MATPFLQRLFLPSPLEEVSGPARIDMFARLRVMAMLSAIFVDGGIYIAFRGSPHFDQRVLVLFAVINIPLLAVAAAVSWFGLRRKGTHYFALSLVCVAIETFSTLVWVQLTGSLSSYFLITLPVLVLSYRLFVSYRLALIAYLTGVSLHLLAVAAEELGILRTASLFTSDPGAIYSEPLFRGAALISIHVLFLAVFVLINSVARAMREKETELEVAQRDLVRVVAAVKPGRLSGQVLDGKYRLGELLGRGGMGEVYQAIEVKGARAVAVKILYAHLAIPDHLERFRREASIAKKLPAVHVAQVFDFGHAPAGDHHYLVLELLIGEDLGTLLRRRIKLPPEELLSIVEQLASGLEVAHASGIVHRDLKPQNVFLVADPAGPHVKLLDFGIARLIEGSELTQSAMLLGSPGYLAPEQAVQEFGAVGPQADVFALGTIVYRALTGENAFPARHPAAAVYEAVHIDPAAPSSLDPAITADVDAVVQLAMAKNPRERYATPTELARDLRAAFAGTLDVEIRVRANKVTRAKPPSPGLDPTITAPSVTPN
ncbi:MAG: serine/threonine-protein kinase [Polyangiales bacterium]